ncbi:PAS fold-containing protein [Nocardia amikacinitolerans]|uniref:PAS and ANTAR domain-containing protein n=1 Tax=Nocardia amikacinitolerans TaxID=756689 RepID=UPI00083350B9|nr:PAS and ANTAR domain-containing protein [Nocardia amikacinitolerans]MCP2317236.1 PAS fold-containing protein [Nocardia amikacinitolerans]
MGELTSETPAGVVAHVVSVGRPQVAGTFRFWFADQRWEWSDEVALMYGYTPGSVTPTTQLLLSHKHPADRELVADAIADAQRNAAPFCSRHRIVDTTGRVHPVLVLGDMMTDDAGNPIGTAGYYIDLTDAIDEQRRETLDEALPELFEARAVIEQAKGVLMSVYSINADQAFRVLRWRSQETNIKLRTLAAQLLTELSALPPVGPGVQTAFDHLLLTLHQRIAPE